MKTTDVIGLGFMTFAFFLGAGNIIFPPMAGFLAGEQMGWAMLGFLVTGVGLPLVTILAIAKAGAIRRRSPCGPQRSGGRRGRSFLPREE